MPEISDGEIVQKFREEGQQEAAFSILVQKYQERLYWHCRKILIDHNDADDALQNTFIKIWKNLAKFREESGLFTWMFRIATNESLTLLKAKKKQMIHIDNEDYETFLSDNLLADEYFDGDEIQLKLQKAILSLPEKQRLVFNMKYFDDMKYEEMSIVLDTSVGALKASYHHAVKKIEKSIKDE